MARSDAKLLLNFDGNANDQSLQEHSTSPSGTFGSTPSLYGKQHLVIQDSADAIDVEGHDDFDVLTHTNWCMEFWYYPDFIDGTTFRYFVEGRVGTEGLDAFSFLNCAYDDTYNYLSFYVVVAGSAKVILTSDADHITSMPSGWKHYLVAKIGTDFGFYYDGDQVAYDSCSDTDAMGTFNILRVGSGYPAEHCAAGYFQDFKVCHNNPYGASPNSGKTDTITVPPGSTYLFNHKIISAPTACRINEVHLNDVQKVNGVSA